MTESTSLKRASPVDTDPPHKMLCLSPSVELTTVHIITPQGWAKAILTITPLGGLLDGSDAETHFESETFPTGDGKIWQISLSPFNQGSPQIGVYFRLCSPLPPDVRQTVSYVLEINTVSADGKVTRELHNSHKYTFSAENYETGFQSALPHSKYKTKFTSICHIELTIKPTTFSKEAKQRTDCVGLVNEGTTCYLNSLLQTFFMIPEFRRAVYQMPAEPGDQDSIPLALQRVFYHLQYDDDAVSTKELLESFGWGVDEFNTQHDVQEFNCTLSARLERKMKGTTAEGTYTRLFEGSMTNFIKCLYVDYESKREEKFLDLQLNVKGLENLYQSFDKYVENEMLTGDNQYETEGFGKQDAKKGIIFRSFPPVLQLQLKRFEYNYLNDSMSKINDHFTFPMTLDLSRYAEAGETYVYTLFSILVHTGSANAGHYFAFIRPEGKGWLKFDDEVVETALDDYAFKSSFGGELTQISIDDCGQVKENPHRNDMSAYMLVYIQASMPQRPISPSDISEHLTHLFAEEKAEKEKIKLTEIMQTQLCTVYLLSFQMVKGWNRPGIITADSEQFADTAFRNNPQSRVKWTTEKALKVRDLRQNWKKKYGLGFVRLWTFSPNYRNWEFKEADDDDDVATALATQENSQTRAVYIDIPKDTALFRRIQDPVSRGEMWEFNEDLPQAQPQEPKIEPGYMSLRSQESIPVFLKWFYCEETGPHIRLISVIAFTPPMTMNQVRSLLLKEEHPDLSAVQVNLYHEKSAGESRGKNVRLFAPETDLELITRMPVPLGIKFIKLDPGDALIGEITPLKPSPSYMDAKTYLDNMQDVGKIVLIHRDKYAHPMVSSFGKTFLDQFFRGSKVVMDLKLSFTVKEAMEDIANEFRQFEDTMTWDRIQFYSYDDYKRAFVETPFPLPEENSISPRAKKPITLGQLICEPNLLYFDVLEFPIPKMNSGFLAQVLYLDQTHHIQRQINQIVGLQATVSDLRRVMWTQLKEAMKADQIMSQEPAICKCYILQAYSRHYICEAQEAQRLEDLLPHLRYQLCFRANSLAEEQISSDRNYSKIFCFHNQNDFHDPFFIFVSQEDTCADVCRKLKSLAPLGVKVKVYSYVVTRGEDRSYDLVKNMVVEECEDRYLERYADQLQLGLEYPRTSRTELWMKDS